MAEDIATICFQFWLLIVSLLAVSRTLLFSIPVSKARVGQVMQDSIPHLCEIFLPVINYIPSSLSTALFVSQVTCSTLRGLDSGSEAQSPSDGNTTNSLLTVHAEEKIC